MNAHILLNLLGDLRKEIECDTLNEFNNTEA